MVSDDIYSLRPEKESFMISTTKHRRYGKWVFVGIVLVRHIDICDFWEIDRLALYIVCDGGIVSVRL